MSEVNIEKNGVLRHLRGIGGGVGVVSVIVLVSLNPWKGLDAANQRSRLPRQIVVAMQNYAPAEFRILDPVIWNDGVVTRGGLCFDRTLFDPESGHPLGTVTECFAEVDEREGGYDLRNVSYLDLPGGRVVVTHHATLQEIWDPTSPATHSVSSYPSRRKPNVIAATGRFQNRTQRVSITGWADLIDFDPESRDSAITFHNWMYLVELTPPQEGRG